MSWGKKNVKRHCAAWISVQQFQAGGLCWFRCDAGGALILLLELLLNQEKCPRVKYKFGFTQEKKKTLKHKTPALTQIPLQLNRFNIFFHFYFQQMSTFTEKASVLRNRFTKLIQTLIFTQSCLPSFMCSSKWQEYCKLYINATIDRFHLEAFTLVK